MNQQRLRRTNARGTSMLEYVLLVNLLSIFLLVALPTLTLGIQTRLSPFQSALLRGGGTASGITRGHGDPSEIRCRDGSTRRAGESCDDENN